MTIWTHLEGGEMGTPPVVDASDELGEKPGTALLMNVGQIPDRVRMPQEIGGRELRVLGRTTFPIRACPNCQKQGTAGGYALEDDYVVGACPNCRNYIWARTT